MKPSIAIHKFSSCDGCQLAFLNAGTALLQLSELVNIKHFAEAGYLNPTAKVDIAFVEGSISTKKELERIQQVRRNSNYLITIGACATAGGIQALRNTQDAKAWTEAIYPQPEFIDSLDTATAINLHVKVDEEIWGCPVNTVQVIKVIRQLLFGVEAHQQKDSVCMECKRNQNTCVLVKSGKPCLGPVTRMGCGALCPSVGAACYGCYGPAELVNTEALSKQFKQNGMSDADIANRFKFISSEAPTFKAAYEKLKNKDKS